MPNRVANVFLMPGDYHVGDARCRISTLLGSCVSITLWHPQALVGAMSHFVLSGTSSDGVRNARYSDDALQLMLCKLRAKGVDPTECLAKVFGGGAMFDRTKSPGLPDVGRRNGEAARNLLLAHNIPIISESLFGDGYRKIMFNVSTGDIWVNYVERAPQTAALGIKETTA
ncbi:chemotaxis protein CheD [Rhodoferax sp. AJA081-3]|uniref:chemotaxis protein CheD n=1 Tax=Rhodoferax sp. AJA081-3 TaxID=2752316 RepID=UPI001AE0ABB3|nr:chemotaxis protein CheD [Rhodoferax sp. AJA081-3]QTN28967.1 chemotaxis protein CheD [Rhodoferax sp. AJA081-3]